RIDQLPSDVPTYLTAAAGPSRYPSRKFCSVCGYLSNYSCKTCGMKYCSVKCLETHEETSVIIGEKQKDDGRLEDRLVEK
ncbi:14422_t:CDS:2, partial [Acaulospora morrowiae]